MAVRWIALAIGLVSLVIVGIFLSAVLWPPTDTGAAAPVAGAKQITGRAGSWTLNAEVIPSSTGAVAVVVSITDMAGQPVTPAAGPTAVARMTGMAMGEIPVALTQDGPGSWRGSGRLPMAGRWSLRVDVGGETIDLPFETTLR